MNYYEQQAEIRRAQRRRSRQATQSAKATLPTVGTYVGRDGVSGYRTIETPDGGIDYTRYYSNAVPPTVPDLYVPGAVARPGVISSKPA